MTAEEFYKQKSWDGIHFDTFPNDIKIMMIEFAQYHVEQTIKSIHANIPLANNSIEFLEECYPLDNIK